MRQRFNALLVAVIAGTITYYSVRPVPTTGYDPAGVNPTLLYHVAAYFALAAALLLYFHDTQKGHIEAIVVAAVFGAGIELVQLQLATRYFSFVDIGVNLLGASILLLDHRSRIVTRIVQWEEQVLAALLSRLL